MTEKINYIPSMFGEYVFGDDVMREKLPRETYKSLKKTIEDGKDLDINVANVVANAMKDWAIEKGATHYTHWFQPMTGITAEKHDSFLSPQKDGTIIMEFSGKELIKGEPDASSFPSGGLRATFEARGYTAWDPTSYAFIKDDSLCIPTVFCSYGGEVLDKKTPLLRSMELISTEAIKLLGLFGITDVKRVVSTVGAEQEYFLVDKDMFEKRKDLIFTGRTLFGAMPPKGQELGDHYFGSIKPRVMAYMEDLNKELWKLGIFAKTEHNEAAPAQHELAPVFTSANIATDHNQLTMEIMKKVANKHNLVCLLHEKPFAGVNGSGKHNNWALSTGKGMNLFDPGKNNITDNKLFLTFLCAVIKAVDKHQDLLRITATSAGNDQRLGGHEAPPAIVSMFLGDDLCAVLEALESDGEAIEIRKQRMETGVHVLPDFQKDTADRNRTSPLAFTGNKFEFRMVGSSFSVADPNTVLNTAVADVISEFYDRLSKAEDFDSELKSLLRDVLKEHKRIIFNGNNYTDEWVKEAEMRGLCNYVTTPDAIPHFTDEKNIELFTKHKIFTKEEIVSRTEILLDDYANHVNIEALTMLEMARRQILPAVFAYTKEVTDTCVAKASIGIVDVAAKSTVSDLTELSTEFSDRIDALEAAQFKFRDLKIAAERANYCRDVILPAMKELRRVSDIMETTVGEKYWPFPTYDELLYGVN